MNGFSVFEFFDGKRVSCHTQSAVKRVKYPRRFLTATST